MKRVLINTLISLIVLPHISLAAPFTEETVPSHSWSRLDIEVIIDSIKTVNTGCPFNIGPLFCSPENVHYFATILDESTPPFSRNIKLLIIDPKNGTGEPRFTIGNTIHIKNNSWNPMVHGSEFFFALSTSSPCTKITLMDRFHIPFINVMIWGTEHFFKPLRELHQPNGNGILCGEPFFHHCR